MASVYEAICQRRTIRRFKQDSIPETNLEDLVNAARMAPSGSNIQPCEYIIVNDPNLIDDLFSYLKWAAYIAPAGDPKVGERPVCYIIVLIDVRKKRHGGEVDAAAGIQNILIAAFDMGIGSCWLGSIHRKKIKTLFRIPHYMIVDSVIALGYPDEKPVIEEGLDTIKYWKDEKDVLHVPKRRLEEICHKNVYGKVLKKERSI